LRDHEHGRVAELDQLGQQAQGMAADLERHIGNPLADTQHRVQVGRRILTGR